LPEAWAFFSSPKNLNKITPKKMGFKIKYISGGAKVYAGQIICYTLRVPPGIRIQWVTEIKHVKETKYFVDEQRIGPYALWHHQHHFSETESGVEMVDELVYALPFGILGRIAHHLFVEREVHAIFDYRKRVLEELFGTTNVGILKKG